MSCCLSCRLYAVVRMVEVVLHNMPRIQQLWPIFEDHVAKTITHPKQGIRTATIDALGKAVVGTLTRLFVVKEEPQQKQVMTRCPQLTVF